MELLRRLWKKGGIALLDQGIASIGTIAVTIMLARYLTMEIYGYFALAHTTLMILTNFVNAFIFNPLLIYTPALDVETFKKHFTATTIFALVLIGLLSAGLGASVLVMRSMQESYQLLLAFTGVTVYFGVFNLHQLFRNAFIARQSYSGALLIDTVFTLGRIGGLWWLASKGLCNTALAAFIVLIAAGLAAIFVGLFHPVIRFRLRFNFLKTVKKHFAFGKWIFLSSIFFNIKQHAYLFLVAGMLSVEAAGALAASLQIARVFNPILMGMQNIITPTAVHVLKDKGAAEFSRWLFRLVLVIGVPLLIAIGILSFFSLPILDIVYDGKYNAYSVVLALALWQMGLIFIDRQGLIGIQVLLEPRYITYLGAFAALLTIPMAYGFIKLWGVTGAVMSSLLVVALFTVLRFVTFFMARARYEKKEKAQSS